MVRNSREPCSEQLTSRFKCLYTNSSGRTHKELRAASPRGLGRRPGVSARNDYRVLVIHSAPILVKQPHKFDYIRHIRSGMSRTKIAVVPFFVLSWGSCTRQVFATTWEKSIEPLGKLVLGLLKVGEQVKYVKSGIGLG